MTATTKRWAPSIHVSLTESQRQLVRDAAAHNGNTSASSILRCLVDRYIAELLPAK